MGFRLKRPCSEVEVCSSLVSEVKDHITMDQDALLVDSSSSTESIRLTALDPFPLLVDVFRLIQRGLLPYTVLGFFKHHWLKPA